MNNNTPSSHHTVEESEDLRLMIEMYSLLLQYYQMTKNTEDFWPIKETKSVLNKSMKRLGFDPKQFKL